MKNLVLLSLTLSLSAFATPKVGDQATFAATAAKGSNTLTGEATLELTAYDAAKKEFTQKTTIKWGNEPANSGEEKFAEADMINDAVLDAVSTAAGCAAEGGKLEKIKVPAGEFNACRVDNTDESGATTNLWVAKVPLGIVRYQASADGLVQNFELKSSKAGK